MSFVFSNEWDLMPLPAMTAADVEHARYHSMASAMAATADVPELEWLDVAIDSGGKLDRVKLLGYLKHQGVAVEEGRHGWRVVRLRPVRS